MGIKKTLKREFIGHVMRVGGLEYLIKTAMMEDKRHRGRQREKMIDGLKKWHGERTPVKLIINTRYREL